MLRDHMLKPKRLTDFRLPYVVLVSKFIEYFGVDIEDELEESIGILNQASYLNLHKMHFTKAGNVWTVGGIGGVTASGANDHEVGPSGANQEEEQEPTAGPMDIVAYNHLKDRGHVYELNVLRGWCFTNCMNSMFFKMHITPFCNERFNDLDG